MHWPANKLGRLTSHPWWIRPWHVPKSAPNQLHTPWTPDQSELRLPGLVGWLHTKHSGSYLEVRWPLRTTSPYKYADTISQQCPSWQRTPKCDHRPATKYNGFCCTRQPQAATSAPELLWPHPGSGRWAGSARGHTASSNPHAGSARWHAASPHMQCQAAHSIPQPSCRQYQVARSIPQPSHMKCQVAPGVPCP